jgi:hypothetical protein
VILAPVLRSKDEKNEEPTESTSAAVLTECLSFIRQVASLLLEALTDK